MGASDRFASGPLPLLASSRTVLIVDSKGAHRFTPVTFSLPAAPAARSAPSLQHVRSDEDLALRQRASSAFPVGIPMTRIVVGDMDASPMAAELWRIHGSAGCA